MPGDVSLENHIDEHQRVEIRYQSGSKLSSEDKLTLANNFQKFLPEVLSTIEALCILRATVGCPTFRNPSDSQATRPRFL